MNDQACVRFLQDTLPRLRMRWPGFRRVRHQVCKRIQRRIRQLELADIPAYRQYLERHTEEWHILDGYCRITISRFYRDQGVYRLLEQTVLPQLVNQVQARAGTQLRIWSAGCGCGEEPYTLVILWKLAHTHLFSQCDLYLLATEVDAALLQRARAACYSASSLRELPPAWRKAAFSQHDSRYCLRPDYQRQVEFLLHDIRSEPPDGPFDLVLCRNLVFTYYASDLQCDIGRRIATVIRPGGLLLLGAHEQLPPALGEFRPWRDSLGAWYRLSPPDA